MKNARKKTLDLKIRVFSEVFRVFFSGWKGYFQIPPPFVPPPFAILQQRLCLRLLGALMSNLTFSGWRHIVVPLVYRSFEAQHD